MANADILAGKWKQVQGRLKEAWGDLTDDDIDRISGRYDTLRGVLQERYGRSKEEAEHEIDDFLRRYG